MAFVIINPNSTASMTAAMLAAARSAAPGLDFEGWTSRAGPSAIEGEADGIAARGPLLALVDDAAAAGADGIVIGCFDDTALAEAAARVSCPVIGLGQAAFHQCAMRNWRFSIVTTLAVSVPIIDGNVARYGLGGYLGRVRASDVAVLDLDRDPDGAVAQILAEARRALTEDDATAIVLGCAGMVQVTQALRSALACEIVDPVESAARALTWLAA
ncbi:MAG: aspartate/glutamate racemase family protein [Pseudomonadota bacterium]